MAEFGYSLAFPTKSKASKLNKTKKNHKKKKGGVYNTMDNNTMDNTTTIDNTTTNEQQNILDKYTNYYRLNNGSYVKCHVNNNMKEKTSKAVLILNVDLMYDVSLSNSVNEKLENLNDSDVYEWDDEFNKMVKISVLKENMIEIVDDQIMNDNISGDENKSRDENVFIFSSESFGENKIKSFGLMENKTELKNNKYLILEDVDNDRMKNDDSTQKQNEDTQTQNNTNEDMNSLEIGNNVECLDRSNFKGTIKQIFTSPSKDLKEKQETYIVVEGNGDKSLGKIKCKNAKKIETKEEEDNNNEDNNNEDNNNEDNNNEDDNNENNNK